MFVRTTATGRSVGSERGAALPFAMLVAILLATLASLLVANALMENRASVDSEQHEGALHVAEAGVEAGVSQVLALGMENSQATTGHPAPADDEDERAWALAIADAVDDACVDLGAVEMESCVVETAQGEAVFIRPQDETGRPLPTLYGVGYVPSKENPANTRVVRLDFGAGDDSWMANHAFLSAGDLRFSGAASEVLGDNGSVHTNKSVRNYVYSTISQSLTWVTAGPSASDGSAYIGKGEYTSVPHITARGLYTSQSAAELREKEEWVDLCADGFAYLADHEVENPQPCEWHPNRRLDSGEHGWQYNGGEWRVTRDVVSERVYYVHHRDARIAGMGGPPGGGGPGGGPPGESATSNQFSIIVEQHPDGHGGSFRGQGNAVVEPHFPGIYILADGDVTLRGTKEATRGNESLIGAGGIVDLSGNYSSDGIAYVAMDATRESRLGGNNSITFNGDLDIADVAGDALRVERWHDL